MVSALTYNEIRSHYYHLHGKKYEQTKVNNCFKLIRELRSEGKPPCKSSRDRQIQRISLLGVETAEDSN